MSLTLSKLLLLYTAVWWGDTEEVIVYTAEENQDVEIIATSFLTIIYKKEYSKFLREHSDEILEV